MKINADIIDYMGKYNNGVLVLISLSLENKFYEGTIFYSDDNIVLTVDEKIENILETKIEYWDGYKELLESILKKLIPYQEISSRLDDVNFEDYISFYEDDFNNLIEDEIDPSQITIATQSNLI
jgi:hypothetical protein